MVENPPSNVGDVGLIPGPGTKIPHAVGQLKPARLNERAQVLQTTEPMCSGALVPQLQSLRALESACHN